MEINFPSPDDNAPITIAPTELQVEGENGPISMTPTENPVEDDNDPISFDVEIESQEDFHAIADGESHSSHLEPHRNETNLHYIRTMENVSLSTIFYLLSIPIPAFGFTFSTFP